MEKRIELATWILRGGLAFSFLYAALLAFIEPLSWIGFLPTWVEIIAPIEVMLIIFALVEIVIALLILFWRSMYPALAGAFLVAITVLANLDSFLILFRDVGIIFMAVALAVLIKEK